MTIVSGISATTMFVAPSTSPRSTFRRSEPLRRYPKRNGGDWDAANWCQSKNKRGLERSSEKSKRTDHTWLGKETERSRGKVIFTNQLVLSDVCDTFSGEVNRCVKNTAMARWYTHGSDVRLQRQNLWLAQVVNKSIRCRQSQPSEWINCSPLWVRGCRVLVRERYNWGLTWNTREWLYRAGVAAGTNDERTCVVQLHWLGIKQIHGAQITDLHKQYAHAQRVHMRNWSNNRWIDLHWRS